MIETMAIYCLVIALLLLFANRSCIDVTVAVRLRWRCKTPLPLREGSGEGRCDQCTWVFTCTASPTPSRKGSGGGVA